MTNWFVRFVRWAGCPILTAALLTNAASGQTNAPLLIIRGVVEKPLNLVLSDLQTMPRSKVTAQEKDGSEAEFEGVALYELVRSAKPKLSDKCCSNTVNTVVIIRAADNYQALFSLPELDPKFGNRHILVADRRQGQPLPLAQGPLLIVVPEDKVHARWVRQVNLIEVFPVGELRGTSSNSPPR